MSTARAPSMYVSAAWMLEGIDPAAGLPGTDDSGRLLLCAQCAWLGRLRVKPHMQACIHAGTACPESLDEGNGAWRAQLRTKGLVRVPLVAGQAEGELGDDAH